LEIGSVECCSSSASGTLSQSVGLGEGIGKRGSFWVVSFSGRTTAANTMAGVAFGEGRGRVDDAATVEGGESIGDRESPMRGSTGQFGFEIRGIERKYNTMGGSFFLQRGSFLAGNETILPTALRPPRPGPGRRGLVSFISGEPREMEVSGDPVINSCADCGRGENDPVGKRPEPPGTDRRGWNEFGETVREPRPLRFTSEPLRLDT
jgi:hypothetical protein